MIKIDILFVWSYIFNLLMKRSIKGGDGHVNKCSPKSNTLQLAIKTEIDRKYVQPINIYNTTHNIKQKLGQTAQERLVIAQYMAENAYNNMLEAEDAFNKSVEHVKNMENMVSYVNNKKPSFMYHNIIIIMLIIIILIMIYNIYYF